MKNLALISVVLICLSVLTAGCSGKSMLKDLRPAAEPASRAKGEAYESLQSMGYLNGADASFPPAAGGTDIPNQKPYDLTFFENYGVNPFISTEDERTSTFGMDVDTASYTIARRYLQDGNIPDKDSIRTEEFINYFKQDYPEPKPGEIFSISVEGAESKFGRPNYHLLKIGVKAKDVGRNDRPAANMIFVVDVSGSMARENRLEQVKRSLKLLAGSLMEGDRIGLVVYGSQGRVISDLTSNHREIMSAISELRSEGSTNAEEGLRLAYEMARENFDNEKINRIILCSDGVANVGNTGADEILKQIRRDADKGITLTTIGFGMGNYNDVLMEKLANHGDGMYYYIDSDSESERIFGGGAAQMLVVLASDAKVQVEFNPDTVDRFRLLGYENRRLKEEDFLDDTVDAGEVGTGQTVTALYEIRIKDSALNNNSAGLATVKIRYLNLLTGKVDEYHESVAVRDAAKSFDSASKDFRFIACVAECAEVLKESYWAKDSSLGDVLNAVEGTAQTGEEREFVDMVRKAVSLEDKRPRQEEPIREPELDVIE